MKILYETLNQLSRLDLIQYPIKEIENHLSSLGENSHIAYIVYPGESILRARPNKTDDEVFSTRSQLSYRPQKDNIDYQRASTPNKTMFYGSIVPEQIAETDIGIARGTACFEAAKTFRNNYFTSIEKITFSRWKVIENINLIMIAFAPNYLRPGSILTILNQSFRNTISKMDQQLFNRSLVINEFLSQQFSKSTIRADYDYLISALYTDLIVKQGFDGVFYPSVKADGRGYNVCLTKECADNKLRLFSAGEGKIIKCGYNTEIINLAQVLVKDQNLKFDFEKIPQEKSVEQIWDDLHNG